MKPLTRFSLMLPNKLYGWLKEASQEECRTMSAQVIEALKEQEERQRIKKMEQANSRVR